MTQFQDVIMFHKKMEHAVRSIPQFPEDIQEIQQYLDLLTEEYIEVLKAFQIKDIVNLAQELVDLAYTCMSTASCFGIPFDAVWAEVHRANMTKTTPPKGQKAIKGEGFVKANVKAIMNYER